MYAFAQLIRTAPLKMHRPHGVICTFPHQPAADLHTETPPVLLTGHRTGHWTSSYFRRFVVISVPQRLDRFELADSHPPPPHDISRYRTGHCSPAWLSPWRAEVLHLAGKNSSCRLYASFVHSRQHFSGVMEEMINGRMAVNAYDCPSHRK